MKRRAFLGTSTGAALTLALPHRRNRRLPPSHWLATPPGAPTLRDPRVKALALTALDAAKTAGARYADVRLTYTTVRGFRGNKPNEYITLGLSVRALVDGYWGWAATPVVAEAEAPRVGREAARLAQTNSASSQPRHVEWGTIPVVSDGTWSTSIRIDPFEIAIDELIDWQNGLSQYIFDLGVYRGSPGTEMGSTVGVRMTKQERVFSSTEGSYLSQTVYITAPTIQFKYYGAGGEIHLPQAQVGWEYVADLPVHDLIRQEMDRIDAFRKRPPLPIKPLDVGRYDIVCAAGPMASLLTETFGAATQVDRALGYEANAGGTSYLGPDPLRYLGTRVAAPLVTVTADRSMPKALATIHWDDDGVMPEDFTLIKDGVLVDYQTTREQAAWLAPWYQQRGTPIRSHGCAATPDALSYTMQHTPNLTLQPGRAELGLEDLIASMEYGLLIGDLNVDMDFQHLNGLGEKPPNAPPWIEVRHGKRVAGVVGGALLFRSPELWKNLMALGGPKSQRWFDAGVSEKGEPSQSTEYSVAAVPALIKQVAVIDPTRRA